MKFFQLTSPDYETDQEQSRENPANGGRSPRLPAVLCPICIRFASSSQIRVSIPSDGAFQELLATDALPLSEWPQIQREVAQRLGVALDRVKPAAHVGPPLAELRRTDVRDFVHPSNPIVIWVRPRVKEAIERSGASGVRFAKVEFVAPRRHPMPQGPLPELWEIVVTGRAWREGMDLTRITLCNVCGRTGFPDPRFLRIDESRWDGSDFLHPDLNPNIVIVTERIAEVLVNGGFTNYNLKPID
jgi:hypothetical protein